MPSQPAGSDASAPRRSARDIIEAVLDNMRRNLEPLKYSTLAPSRYLVYLHPTEYARLEGILRRFSGRRPSARLPKSSRHQSAAVGAAQGSQPAGPATRRRSKGPAASGRSSFCQIPMASSPKGTSSSTPSCCS